MSINGARIMAFIGTDDSAELMSELAEHISGMYAAVSDEYGRAKHPIGDITLLSKYLDRDNLIKWLDRNQTSLVIDGTSLAASEQRRLIKQVCDEKGIEYFHIAAKLQSNINTTIFRNDDQLIREFEYSVGRVMVQGDRHLFEVMTGVREYSDKVIPVIPADTELINSVVELGYKRENIISINRPVHSDLLIAIFHEYKVSNYVFLGSDLYGLQERLDSVDRSSVKGAVYGDFASEEGIEVNRLWDKLTERFGIED